MKNSYQVRRATINDLPHILSFIIQEAVESEGRAADLSKLETGISTALNNEAIAIYWMLVDHDSQPVGCTSVVKEWSDWNAGYYWWIQSLFLDPKHRGQGLLNVMMDTVAVDAKADSCLEIRLYVHRDNSVAIRAYQKAEFQPSDYKIMTKKF
ncbi:GNAT family N-acetyltransferase [Marinobacterium sp. xm-a-152]|uniref:GNAT family N-acetyltransferase n=1 Tax=Marinobacterium sp. xm-a-152 TaxID=2497733 RepID=UPI0015680500|nr:GNAT family N-acetyltransferase [Marinobacterium sp. xm-a-152]NRP16464.1 putative acetyltransferase [Marinobacterium sp. xm-a-152]